MKTLEITKDAAIKAYKNASPESKTLLEDLFSKENLQSNPIDRIKTVEDIILKSGYKSTSEFYDKFASLPEHLVSEMLIEMLAKLLNEGFIPNWDDGNEYKYFPYFIMSSSGFRFHVCDSWDSGSHVGSRLCFKSRELAEYAGKTFTELYENYMTIK